MEARARGRASTVAGAGAPSPGRVDESAYHADVARRGQYAKGIEKRAEILRTALEVFAQDGYRGTSVRTVAERCGLSPAGLLHYFESREDMLAQVLVARDEEAAEAIGDDAWGGFLRVVHRDEAQPGLVALYVTLAAAARDESHPAHGPLVGRYERLHARAVAEVRTRQAAGLMDPGLDPDDAARLIVAVADGAQLQWLVDPSVDLAGPLRTLARLLGLETQPERA